MAGNIQYALNENAVNNIIMETLNIAEEIKSIFNKMDATILKVEKCYTGSSSTKLQTKYASFRDNYQTIIDNILSYSTDMSSLKKKYRMKEEVLIQNLTIARGKVETEKPLEYKEER